MFKPNLEPHTVITNRELMAIFKCACEGGVRPSKTTNSIVLVVNHFKGTSGDSWQGDILPFTGAGSGGNQTLEKGKNKTLLNALNSNLPVYLFEVFQQGKYTFAGQVQLAATPYEAVRADINGNERKVWLFPLKLIKARI